MVMEEQTKDETRLKIKVVEICLACGEETDGYRCDICGITELNPEDKGTIHKCADCNREVMVSEKGNVCLQCLKTSV
jgi:hypothetical protein